MGLRTRHWDRLGNGGLTFTELGFGAAPLGNLYPAISDAKAEAILDRAWTSGVRYCDTARLYGLGLSESRHNRFLRGKSRDNCVLSTKFGRLLRATTPEKRDGFGKWFDMPSRNKVYNYGYDGVCRSFDFSLEWIEVDRVDILYAHDLDPSNHGTPKALAARLKEFMDGGYRALSELRGQGVIHAFGAGIDTWEPAQWMVERGDFDLFLLAGRYTLLELESLTTFLPLCAARGIGIVFGGPYNSGIIATGPRPGAFYNCEPAPPEILARGGRIKTVCKEDAVHMVDAAFQFPLRHPAVVSVIPGGQDVAQMDANLVAAEGRNSGGAMGRTQGGRADATRRPNGVKHASDRRPPALLASRAR